MKLIILLVIVYFGYRKLKSWALENINIDNRQGLQTEIADDLIKDPHCQTYFPRRNAHHLLIHGDHLYFCSAKCRDEYEGTHLSTSR